VVAFNDQLAAIAEEMGVRLEQSAYSPNIKERRDYSCAIFNASGRLAAQAAHIPVHLGAMAALVKVLRKRVNWSHGDTVICNDPYLAGTHLPDISLVSPVFDKELIGFVASRAHHADIGGATPGSMPLTGDLFGEGIRIPPMLLVRRGRLQTDVLDLLCANSRAPVERRGDIAAQMAANSAGETGMLHLVGRIGARELNARIDEAIAYTSTLLQTALRHAPAGTYQFEDALDSDGITVEPVPITVAITIGRNRMTFDFTGSAPQRSSGVNATLAVTESACLYAARCLLPPDAPTNEGCSQGLKVIAQPGTVVNASFPAAVAGGNVETSQRITDVVLAALSRAFPNHIPAASQGTMNNLTFGGWDPARGRAFAYYETIGGGGGAGPTGPGTSGIHSHMTNTRNTPAEALEYAMPLRVTEYQFVAGTGGDGLHDGGDGVRRSFLFLTDVSGTLMAERRQRVPYGLAGGSPGATGSDVVIIVGKHKSLPAKGPFHLPAGSNLTIQTPGGGGWGKKP